MKKYILFIFFTFLFINGCSSKNSKELWDEAVDLQKNNKIEDAASAYEKLEEEFPDSPEAPKALFEAAKLYQCKPFKNLSDKESCIKAISLYQKIYEKYPNSSESPKALFMIAFIKSNDLNDFDGARNTFIQFLTKYPDHEMAASAKAEVDNMGLTPEEIIKRNTEAQGNGRDLPGL